MSAVKGTLAKEELGKNTLLGAICGPGELVGCHREHLPGILLMMQAQPSQLGPC